MPGMSRRTAIAAAGMVATAGAISATMMTPPGRPPLLAACYDLRAAVADQKRIDAGPLTPAALAASEVAADAQNDAAVRLLDMPARTLPEVQEKARAVAELLRYHLHKYVEYTVEEQADTPELLALLLAEDVARL